MKQQYKLLQKRKPQKHNLTRICVFVFCVFALLLCSFSVNSSSVKAVEAKKTNPHFSTLGNATRQELQFMKKINLIKGLFPNQIDEVVLAATVLHRGNASDIVSSEYDKDFKESDYKKKFEDIKKGSTEINQNKNTIKAEISKQSVEDESIDLLTAATIVMLDSSGWFGSYNEENYMKALAGTRLVGWDFKEDDIVGNVFNGIFCGAGFVADAGTTAITTTYDIFANQKDIVSAGDRVGKRFYNMLNICTNGYIGGTYDQIRSIQDDSQRQSAKDQVAQEIIALANEWKKIYGKDKDACTYANSYTGDAVNWRQSDPAWGSITFPGGDTVVASGCTSTAMAYLLAKSGTQLTVENFNPGVFVQNAGYVGNLLDWTSISRIAPNWHMESQNQIVLGNPADALERISNNPKDGYQRFIILELVGHWVAFDHVENGTIYVMDPAAFLPGLVTLEQVGRGSIQHFNVFYATDVPFGSSGTGSGSSTGSSGTGGGSSTGSSSNQCDTGTGEIIIPEEFGNGGYTITEYDRFNWVYDQGRVYQKWLNAGGNFTEGIATYEDRFLIACTETFGKVGDKVDFFLYDGTKIPAVIADMKSSGDAGYNKWGHNNGQNVLEFEVASAYYHQYGNPGSGNGWYDQWHGKRVASATNLGSIF